MHFACEIILNSLIPFIRKPGPISGVQGMGGGAEGRPAPMEGAGGYNRASAVQAAGLSPAVPLFRDAADHATLPRRALR